MKKNFNDSDAIILNWYYLYSNKIISVVHCEEKIDQLRLRVIDKVNEIISVPLNVKLLKNGSNIKSKFIFEIIDIYNHSLTLCKFLL